MSDFQAKVQQNRLWLRLRHIPCWGSLQPLRWNKAGLLLREVKGKGGKGEEDMGGKDRGKEEKELEGTPCVYLNLPYNSLWSK